MKNILIILLIFLSGCASSGRDCQNDTVLSFATRRGDERTVKLLLDHGADIHANNDAALREASFYGHLKIVRLLLDRGADVHAVNDDALVLANIRGHSKIIKLLKERMKKGNK